MNSFINFISNRVNIFIFSIFILFFLTIGSNIHQIYENFILFLSSNNYSIYNFILSSRAIITYLMFLIFFIFFIKDLKNIEFNFKRNFIYYVFFLYSFSSLIGLNMSCTYADSYYKFKEYACIENSSKNFLFSFHFLFSQFAVITFLFLLQNYKYKKKQVNKNIFLNVLFAIIFFTFLFTIYLLISSDYSYASHNLNFINNVNITSNGAGRYALILNIFILSLYFFGDIKIKIISFIIILLSIYVSFYIFSLNGKFNILSLYISFIFFLFFSYKKFLIKFLFIFLIILFSNFFNFLLLTYKSNNIEKKCIDIVAKKERSSIEQCINENKYLLRHNSFRLYNVFSRNTSVGSSQELDIPKEVIQLKRLHNNLKISKNKNAWNDIWLNGRTTKYKFLLEEFFNRKLYFGGGPEFDRSNILSRAIFNEKLYSLEKGFITKQISSDAANGFLYALLSSGVLGGVLYLLIIIYFIYAILFFYKRRKNYINQPYVIFSIIVLGYIVGRSLIENGFISWSVDFLILIGCFSYINNEIISQKK
jgi:hypothetical protein